MDRHTYRHIILISSLCLLFLQSQTAPVIAYARSTPFLGVGLGWNTYNKQDVSELGPAWVYNWTVPSASGNNPYSDFGAEYVPMVFGCGGNDRVKTWIQNTSYQGPVLFLNEPDNGTGADGSNCPPETAIPLLEDFINWKNTTYLPQTGRTIDIIFGGWYWGPDMCLGEGTNDWCGKKYTYNGVRRFWFDDFYVRWCARHTVNGVCQNPDIAGVHFHLYPWYPDDYPPGPTLPDRLSKESLVAHLKRRMTGGRDPVWNIDLPGWKTWLNNPANRWALGTKGELWITEFGVLLERVPKDSVEYVMQQMIPYLSQDTQIKRVSWFSHAVLPARVHFDQTALMSLDNQARTSTWSVFRSLCTTQGYCVPGNSTPTPTRTGTPTPPAATPTGTRTPTPTMTSPTGTATPTPPTAPSPTLIASPTLRPPSPTLQPTSPPSSCNRSNPVQFSCYGQWYLAYNAGGNPLLGDFDGDSRTSLTDYELWRRVFVDANAPLTTHTPTPTSIQSGPTPTQSEPTATPAIAASCLSQPGPLTTISGSQTVRYDRRNMPFPASAKIDARTAVWKGVHDYPVLIAGGSNVCFSGGNIQGTYPPDTTWDVMHSTAAFFLYNPNTTIENIRIDDYGDAISVHDGGANFTIRGAYISYNRDDCVEDDWLYSGLIDDSLFDGCYQGISTRTYAGQANVTDGSANTVTVQNSLMRLQAMEKVYKDRGLIPGHDGFFKWDPAGLSPKLALHNNIFRADQPANNVGLGIPAGKLASCTNNTMVWLGTGPYPEPLPTTLNGQPCFTITTDKSVWDTAVAAWKTRHGY